MSRKPLYDSVGHSDKYYIERQPRHQSYSQKGSTSRGYHLDEYPYHDYADATDNIIPRYEDLPYRQPQEAQRDMVKSSKRRQTENAYSLSKEPWSASNSRATSYRPSDVTSGPHLSPLSLDALSYNSSCSPSYTAKPQPETSDHILQGSPYDDGSFSSGTEVIIPGSHANCIKDPHGRQGNGPQIPSTGPVSIPGRMVQCTERTRGRGAQYTQEVIPRFREGDKVTWKREKNEYGDKVKNEYTICCTITNTINSEVKYQLKKEDNSNKKKPKKKKKESKEGGKDGKGGKGGKDGKDGKGNKDTYKSTDYENEQKAEDDRLWFNENDLALYK